MADKRDDAPTPGHYQSDWPAYSFLNAAAAEARERSRNHWYKGGAADLAAPMMPNPGWYGKKKPTAEPEEKT